MSELSTIKWGKAASQDMHLGGVYICPICNMWVEHGSNDCPHSNMPKQPVPPAMSRALEPEMYNVLAGEIRKLGERLERIESHLSTATFDGFAQAINERLRGIEASQLEGHNDERKALMNVLLRVERCQESHRLALESIVRILEKLTCGARKRQPKPARKAGKRKSTRKP